MFAIPEMFLKAGWTMNMCDAKKVFSKIKIQVLKLYNFRDFIKLQILCLIPILCLHICRQDSGGLMLVRDMGNLGILWTCNGI